MLLEQHVLHKTYLTLRPCFICVWLSQVSHFYLTRSAIRCLILGFWLGKKRSDWERTGQVADQDRKKVFQSYPCSNVSLRALPFLLLFQLISPTPTIDSFHSIATLTKAQIISVFLDHFYSPSSSLLLSHRYISTLPNHKPNSSRCCNSFIIQKAINILMILFSRYYVDYMLYS